MTLFLSVRSQDVGGPVVPAFLVESSGGAQPVYARVDPAAFGDDDGAAARDRFAGHHLVLAVHGFNVSRPNAVRSLVALEQALALPGQTLFLGVLWPGDYWIPAVNYPAEVSDAMTSGRYVAEFLNRHAAGALTISFISHSLGGRVLLEAVKRLARPALQACITAGAVEDDTLHGQYAEARRNAGRVSVLASRADQVLRLAYPLGDFFSIFFGSGDNPFREALGREGPHPAEAWPQVSPRQIPDAQGYDHGDYFPPSDPTVTRDLWKRAAAYMRRAVDGEPDAWG